MELFNKGGFRIDESLKANWGADESKILDDLIKVSELRVEDGEFSRFGAPPHADWSAFSRGDLDFIDSVTF